MGRGGGPAILGHRLKQGRTVLHRTYEARKGGHAWLWALLPLLLAAGLTVTALGKDVFDADEAATMLGAGARHIGPIHPQKL